MQFLYIYVCSTYIAIAKIIKLKTCPNLGDCAYYTTFTSYIANDKTLKIKRVEMRFLFAKICLTQVYICATSIYISISQYIAVPSR